MTRLKPRRKFISGIMAKAQLNPGRLKVLLGDMRVIVRAAASGFKVAVGICFFCLSRIKSQ